MSKLDESAVHRGLTKVLRLLCQPRTDIFSRNELGQNPLPQMTHFRFSQISLITDGPLVPRQKIKKIEATFWKICPSSFILRKPFSSNVIRKKVKFGKARCHFRLFYVSKVITTAHAHKSGVIFHIFQDLSNKNLRPKMTKIASRGSCLNCVCGHFCYAHSPPTGSVRGLAGKQKGKQKQRQSCQKDSERLCGALSGPALW